MSALLALLDQLDEARAKATPGEWVVDEEWIWAGVEAEGAFGELITRAADVEDADVELIVAAVNALPQLTAALRVVVEAVDEWERNAETSDGRIPRWLVASVLRGAITDALTPEQVQP